MHEKGLSAIHMVCGQADDKADAVMLNDYNCVKRRGARVAEWERLEIA